MWPDGWIILNIWPFATMKTSPIMSQICQSSQSGKISPNLVTLIGVYISCALDVSLLDDWLLRSPGGLDLTIGIFNQLNKTWPGKNVVIFICSLQILKIIHLVFVLEFKLVTLSITSLLQLPLDQGSLSYKIAFLPIKTSNSIINEPQRTRNN